MTGQWAATAPNGTVPIRNGSAEAIFYSYTVPEPAGLKDQRVRPEGAAFSDTGAPWPLAGTKQSTLTMGGARRWRTAT